MSCSEMNVFDLCGQTNMTVRQSSVFDRYDRRKGQCRRRLKTGRFAFRTSELSQKKLVQVYLLMVISSIVQNI